MSNTRAIIIDIESNNLLANMLDYSSFPYKLNQDAKMWCVVLRDAYTDEVISQTQGNLTKEWLKKNLEGCTHLIGHNIIKFDLLVLKLFGLLDYEVGYLNQEDTLFGKPVKIIDTLIISRLLNPDRFGGHSLESWGERVGAAKIDFRQICIDKGYIAKGSPKGAEFQQYCTEMLVYCEQDTETNKHAFFAMMQEIEGYKGWNQAIKIENKLADLAVRRETLGFWFDKDLAIKCVEDLTEKMDELRSKVNPLLPPKPMTKTELGTFTPPATQFLKSGKPSTHIIKFAARIGAVIEEWVQEGETVGYVINFEGKRHQLPFTLPLKTHVPADISNLDHVKMYLQELGWEAVEWRERDLTKDSKKQNLPYEKRVAALERWYRETMEGKYKKARLKILGMKPEKILDSLKERLKEDKPVRVPTSPMVRIGVEKELCPNLVALGEKVAFANDFALYLTYKHRKSSIAGGELEDVDYDEEYPSSGFLSMYREVDSRIPTPAIEIGAATNRYRHIGVCNVARATSIYGKELRSLFGCGKDGLQFGYDFASLEARINGHYVWKYPYGEELAATMLAEKPNDIHSVNARKMGISRGDAKSLGYGIMYGAQPAKVAKMLNVPLDEGKRIYNDYWDAVPALKDLKTAVEAHWKDNDKKFILGIDGRKINIRSQHSILNALFQSAGVISAKYVNVLSMQYLEELGHNIDPFKAEPDVCEMIAYHDECQLYVSKKSKITQFKTFTTEEEALEFVKEWKGEEQLSAISQGKVWYVALPNDVSKSIEKAIRETEKLLKLNVPLGYEWIVNSTWYGCH